MSPNIKKEKIEESPQCDELLNVCFDLKAHFQYKLKVYYILFTHTLESNLCA